MLGFFSQQVVAAKQRCHVHAARSYSRIRQLRNWVNQVRLLGPFLKEERMSNEAAFDRLARLRAMSKKKPGTSGFSRAEIEAIQMAVDICDLRLVQLQSERLQSI